MSAKWLRFRGASLPALLLLPLSLAAYDYPVSDTAVRSAYFLGQRHDLSMLCFLGRYTRHLPLPKSGPDISSISFLTPYAQLVEFSDRYPGNFSAQQAELAHRQIADVVKIVIEIQLTSSYGPYVSPEGSSQPPAQFGSEPRSSDFWREFQISVQDDRVPLNPSRISGHGNYFCEEARNCILRGATITYTLPADSFHSDTAHVELTPPEGDPLAVDFDLASLR